MAKIPIFLLFILLYILIISYNYNKLSTSIYNQITIRNYHINKVVFTKENSNSIYVFNINGITNIGGFEFKCKNSTSNIFKNIYSVILWIYIDIKISTTQVELINNIDNHLIKNLNYSIPDKVKGLFYYLYIMFFTDAYNYRVIFPKNT